MAEINPSGDTKDLPLNTSAIETVDGAFLDYVKGLNLRCDTINGIVTVPVIWSSAERSFQIKDNAQFRDKNGSLIPPIISIERVSIVKDPAMKGSFRSGVSPKHDRYYITKILNQDKTSNFANANSLRKNRQLNFQTSKKNKNIVYQHIAVQMPVYVTVEYKIHILTNYQAQMNELVQPFITRTAQNYFIIEKDGYRFESFMDQNFTQDSIVDLNQEERKFKSAITVRVLGQLVGDGFNQEDRNANIHENGFLKLPKENILLDTTDLDAGAALLARARKEIGLGSSGTQVGSKIDYWSVSGEHLRAYWTISVDGVLTPTANITSLTASQARIPSFITDERTNFRVNNNNLDFFVGGANAGGTQILFDATNSAGISQTIVQAGTYALLQAGESGSWPFYVYANDTEKFVALEADDSNGTIYVGGTGYDSDIYVGSAGSRFIEIGNTSSFTQLNIKTNLGTKVTGSFSVSGTVSASYLVGDGSGLTNLPTSNFPTRVEVSGALAELSGAITGAYVTLNTDQTISGSKTFVSSLILSGSPTNLEISTSAGTHSTDVALRIAHQTTSSIVAGAKALSVVTRSVGDSSWIERLSIIPNPVAYDGILNIQKTPTNIPAIRLTNGAGWSGVIGWNGGPAGGSYIGDYNNGAQFDIVATNKGHNFYCNFDAYLGNNTTPHFRLTSTVGSYARPNFRFLAQQASFAGKDAFQFVHQRHGDTDLGMVIATSASDGVVSSSYKFLRLTTGFGTDNTGSALKSDKAWFNGVGDLWLSGSITASTGLLVTGSGKFTGPVDVAAGVAATPGLTFGGVQTGFWRAGADLYTAHAGATGFKFTSTGLIYGPTATSYLWPGSGQIGIYTATGYLVQATGEVRAVSAYEPANATFRITPVAGQTKPLQRWENASGSAMATVDLSGSFFTSGSITASTAFSAESSLGASSGDVCNRIGSTVAASSVHATTDVLKIAVGLNGTEQILSRWRRAATGVPVMYTGGGFIIGDDSTTRIQFDATGYGYVALYGRAGVSTSSIATIFATDRLQPSASTLSLWKNYSTNVARVLGDGSFYTSGSITASQGLNVTGSSTFNGALLGVITSLTSSGASLAINLSAANYFEHTLTEDTTLAAPTNVVAGQNGTIVFTQDAVTPRTLSYNSFWKFAGGVTGSLTATTGAIDVLSYYVTSGGFAVCSMANNFS